MPTAAELLAKTSNTDKTLVIDNDLRTIEIPSSVTNLGVESDDKVLRLNFRMPRYLGKTDLSIFAIRINYLNASGEGDTYFVNDMEIVGDNLTFSWLVGPNATAYKGDTQFNVCMKIVDSQGYIQKEYNTTIATLPVLEGLETEKGIVESYPDILEQWKNQLFGISGTEEAKLHEKSEEEQEIIAQKGIEVLATIPEDYQTTYKMANDAYRTRANAILASAQGETVVLNDSSKDPLRGLRIFGKTTQVTTTGKNLLQVTATSCTIGGITYTVNPDGSILANGTATEESFLTVGTMSYAGGKEYKITGCPNDGSMTTYTLYTLYGEGVYAFDTGNGIAFTPSADITKNVSIKISKDVTVTNILYHPMVCLTSVSDDTYEVYSGGVSSPSPDWPQRLMNVGDNGSIGLCLATNNLFDKDIYVFIDATTIDKTTGEITSTTANGWRTFENLLMVEPNSDYVLSGNVVPAAWTSTIAFYDANKAYITCVKVINNGGKNSLKFTTPDKAVYLRFNAHVTGLDVDTIVLNSDTSAIEYEIGQTQTLLINTPSGLSGIPVSQNGNYTDANGQQWICDEIDFERGVYIQRVAKKVFDGTETSWRMHSSLYTFMVDWSGVSGGWQLCHAKASHFTCSTEAYSNVIGHFAIDEKGLCYFATGHATLDEFLAWLTENPVTVVTKLITPIETELTAEELVTFRALHTNYPNTTILNDSGAHMAVEYNADTKMFFENHSIATDSQVEDAVTAYLDRYFINAEGVKF